MILWATISFLTTAAICFVLTAYWLYGAHLWRQATAAIRRGDDAEATRLEQRAERWTLGARIPPRVPPPSHPVWRNPRL